MYSGGYALKIINDKKRRSRKNVQKYLGWRSDCREIRDLTDAIIKVRVGVNLSRILWLCEAEELVDNKICMMVATIKFYKNVRKICHFRSEDSHCL